MQLDEELRDSHEAVLVRFYVAFEAVYKYIRDLVCFLDDVEQGHYIQQTLTTILLTLEGKQLLVVGVRKFLSLSCSPLIETRPRPCTFTV